MRAYNGVYLCERDNPMVHEHVATMKVHFQNMGWISEYCLYYAMGSVPVTGHPCFVCGVQESYEELPSKTYCMFKHALQVPDWDIFIKTDVNAMVTGMNSHKMAQHPWSGCLGEPNSYGGPTCGGSYFGPEREHLWHTGVRSSDNLEHPALSEPHRGPFPLYWTSCCYALHRSAAEWVVEKGIWYARSFNAEDHMVSVIMAEHGLVPVRTITYTEKEHDS